jgi:flagellar assembly protein FliH
MSAPAKFLFNDDFANAAPGKPTVAVAEHAAKLRDAEAVGYARGLAAAKEEAKADAAQRTTTALERIGAALTALGAKLSAVEQRLESEAVEVALEVGRKLAPALIAREPFAEISALASGCFQHLVAAPHVVVRLNEALQGIAQKHLEDVVHGCGFTGRLVVLAEPEIAPGDCRIEWADGGVSRDRAAIVKAVDDAVARYVHARNPTSPITITPLPENPWSFER